MGLKNATTELIKFPLQDYTKIPAVQWMDYKKPLPEQITTYGINCKESNLVVMDLDVHDDNKNGILEWLNIIEGQDLEDTFTVSTPSGGMHYYYKDTTNGEIRNSASKLGPGIDVRANGGYVVGPGSIIRDNDGEEKTYKIENNVEIQPLPDFLRDKILKISNPQNNKIDWDENYTVQNTTISYLNKGEAEKLLQGAVKELIIVEEGKRNDALNKITYHLAKDGVEPTIINKRISVAAEIMGLEEHEINKTIEQAITKGNKLYLNRVKKQMEKDEKELENNKSPLESPSGYFSDVVMSYRLKEVLLEENYCYVSFSKEWRKYNELIGIWETVTYAGIIKRIANWCHNEVKNTASTKDVDMIKASMRCLNKNTVSNLLMLNSGLCEVNSDMFDQRKDIIVVQNGVVDLRNKKLLPFDPNYYSTKRINIPWEPDKERKSKYLHKILEALPDDSRDWFLIMAGQSLTGYQPSKDTVFFLKGNGANGKSTIFNLMTVTAGDYGGLPPQASLIRSKNADNFNTIVYKDIHQAIVEELPDKQLDTVRLKNLTGTDKITARSLYQNNETFNLRCTIWISCNILPQVVEYDYGTWRRIVLVEFDKTFKKSSKDIKGPNDRLGSDAVRLAALHDPLTHEDFLNLRIEGAYKWFQNHMSDPDLPPSVKTATENWKNKGDTLRSWFNDCLEYDINSFILNEDARDSYNNWLIAHGYSPISHKVFLDRFENHDIYEENKLLMTKKGRTSKLLQSTLNDKDNHKRMASDVCAHIKYVKFI